ERRRGDEPLRDGVSASAQRWLVAALVHAIRRSRTLRPRHARQRARIVGRESAARGRDGALSYEERRSAGEEKRRLDRARLPGNARGEIRGAGNASGIA